MFARQTMPATRRSGHRPLALRCLGAAVGLALLAAPAALAQDADTSDNTPVSHDGAGLGSTESGSSLSQSFAGTGRVLAAGETDDALADRRGLKESAADVWKLWEAAPATAPVGVESILGADNRERVRNTSEYPYRAIALVTFTDANGSSSRCTGWLINADTVVTAGHCVHGGGSGEDWHRVDSFRVYPGRDGSASPYGSCTAKRLYSVRGWTRNAADTSDYGAIKLN